MREDGRAGSGASGARLGLDLVAGLVLVASTVAMLGLPFAAGRPRAELTPVVGLMTLVVTIAATLWLLRERRSGSGAGLALGLAAACCPLWAAWLSVPTALVGLFWALTPLVVPGLGAVAWSWLTGRRHWSAGVAWALSVGAGLVLVAGYAPFDDPGCTQRCVDTSPLLAGLLTAREAAMGAGCMSVAAACFALLAVLHRTAGRPVELTAGVVVALCIVAAGASTRVVRWDRVGVVGPTWAGLIAVLVASSAVCLVAVRILRMRRQMRGLVDRLSRPSMSPGLGSSGAVQVHFRMPMGSRWVDGSGTAVAVPARPDEGDRRMGGIRFVSNSGRDLTGLADRLDATDWALLSNLREAAISRALQREVRESQARIVTAGDEERRRIERDLHDGAQQRLVAAQLHLALARQAPGGASDQPSLDLASSHVRSAIEALRSLAHGAFPRVLDSHGLSAALDELAADREFPVSIDADSLPQNLPRGAAMAAYQTVATVIRAAGRDPRRASVDAAVRSRPESLWVRVTTNADRDDFGQDLTLLIDRVGALGGVTDLSDRQDGTMLTVELPCVS